MLRKDVRIGLAIGGGLLAVLVVYLLITSGPPKNAEVTLVPDDTGAAPAPTNGQPSGDAATIDPFKDSAGATPQPTKQAGPTTEPSDRWQRALSTGKVESDTPPLLLTETPSPAPTRPENQASTAPPTTSPSANAATPPATTPPSGTSAQTSSAAPRTHVIQTGESFSTIAQAVYGNSSYYPHLIRANPNIDPKKLRPGMTIVIPDAAQVVATASPDTTPAVDSKPAIPIDDKREYRVQPGDSLYKIALKLYGRADRADAIYDLNKDAIGPNRSYLKVGMTLKLPDPPTQASAAR